MIKSPMAVKARIKNKAGGNSDKSQIMRGYLHDVIDKVYNAEILKSQWDNYQRDNYYVGKIAWDEVCESVGKLELMVQ